jgi:hypothetical protein
MPNTLGRRGAGPLDRPGCVACSWLVSVQTSVPGGDSGSAVPDCDCWEANGAVKRADSNHWAFLVLAVLAANVAVPILLLRTDTGLAVGAAVLFALALFVLARRLTCTRRWWVLPLVGSPLVVIPFLLGLLFVGAIMGIVPVP